MCIEWADEGDWSGVYISTFVDIYIYKHLQIGR